MPRYLFKCEECGRTEEVDRPVRERDDETRCPVCARQMTRQPSAPGFVVNGFAASNGYSRTV